jgi:hypothetical protein
MSLERFMDEHVKNRVLVQQLTPEQRTLAVQQYMEELPAAVAPYRQAIEAAMLLLLAQVLDNPLEKQLVPVNERLPDEGVEVYVYSADPITEGDAWDTDWLEEGFFAENKGKVTHWLPKYPQIKHPPRKAQS